MSLKKEWKEEIVQKRYVAVEKKCDCCGITVKCPEGMAQSLYFKNYEQSTGYMKIDTEYMDDYEEEYDFCQECCELIKTKINNGTFKKLLEGGSDE